ncbi:ketopantoate reductase family protein [Saccharibacillus sp. JS10]|uniref:ketopantoate reductase family protein n=1 Tax=Saccharibacillus sp. JS10 TaxID=2950552 RepID=UPI00210EFCA7|nr:2-dehydropantoate 2-reductase N-terminal domain-containing protein [Saccharibacillus sp. JS10]MCQ4085559.1 ketopantoate reductase family protein [Saccharibacillus sp. JS10]
MRILILGAGVLGSVLGQLLIKGRHDVTFLARGKRAEQLRRDGLVIKHHLQNKTTVDWPKVIETLAADDRYDLIFTVMKYSDIRSILPILAQNNSQHIMMIGNNPSIEDTEQQLQKMSTDIKQVAFGFLVGAGVRKEDGKVVSLRVGKMKLIAGGQKGKVPILPLLQNIFEAAPCKLTLHTDIDGWLKNHIIPILPLSAAWQAHDGDFKAVAKDKALLKQVVEAMIEGFDRLEHAGYPLVPIEQARKLRKYRKILPILLGIYHRLPIAKLVDSSTTEARALEEAFRKLTESSNQATPNWDNLFKNNFII